ncbi:histidine kinase [Mucilaginibacter sp. ZT4R22]|uniref:Histidine kinase n=1 Tax=Mucilaginibacter pankratovii TaxID=2772110 RepID=A0ABR7WZ70_9SPHI|nr:sensor histidine kinase [Mucilaginibacter pankratovii]MBD1367572.1 histidine kinase [Mucilaginibacter pankratovii]
MKLFSGKLTAVQLQQSVWVSVFVVIMLSLLPMDTFGQAFAYAIIYTAFYAAIIYGNILWLFPRLYQKGHIVLYILAVIVFLFVVGITRGFVTMTVYNTFFAPKPQVMTFKVLSTFIVGGILIFLLSFIFRIAIAYFDLKRQSEEIIVQKTQAELNLLKSQVQPHFLFNTLNNIYYEAYLEAPRTAALIERLSNIMRYFVDESPKQLVSIGTEVQFIENYIELEKIRIRYDISLNFTKVCDAALSIPPMLLMAFVENVFKHGIDKSSADNRISLSLIQESDRLLFTVENTLPDVPLNPNSTGSGIGNLRKRLILLYQDDFELSAQNNGDIYRAHLNIPLK